MIEKGQSGPTQRESNKMHIGGTNRSKDTAKQQMQDTVLRNEHNTNHLLCRVCASGMVTGIPSPVLYTGVHNANAALPPVFATTLWKIHGQAAKWGGWDTAPSVGPIIPSGWTATWEYREQAQTSPLRRGWGNFSAVVCKFIVWTVTKKSQVDSFRQTCVNTFSEYSTSSTLGF